VVKGRPHCHAVTVLLDIIVVTPRVSSSRLFMPRTSKNSKANKRFVTNDNLVQRERAITSTSKGIYQKTISVPVVPIPELVTPEACHESVEGTEWNSGDMFVDAMEFQTEANAAEVSRVKVTKPKARRYQDSVRVTSLVAMLTFEICLKDTPLVGWLEKHREEYLDWTFASEGRGRIFDNCCSNPGCTGEPLYRCLDCIGYAMICKECIVKAHRSLPCHRVQVTESSLMFGICSLSTNRHGKDSVSVRHPYGISVCTCSSGTCVVSLVTSPCSRKTLSC
jgi:hypothetical protein